MSDETNLDDVFAGIKEEIAFIWRAHKRVGLSGQMCLYSFRNEEPFRSQAAGFQHWFGESEEEIEAAVAMVREHYNEGKRPNTSLLLNPLVHEEIAEGTFRPIGSGIIWGTAFSKGISNMTEDKRIRVESLGVKASYFVRGDKPNAGLKMLGISDVALEPKEGGVVEGMEAIYEVADIESDEYWKFYLFSGMSYLCSHGAFEHPDFRDLFKREFNTLMTEVYESESTYDEVAQLPLSDIELEPLAIHTQPLLDAQTCWNSYDRHPSLYERFGNDVTKLKENLRFYKLCARDFELFDATGPMRGGSDTQFEFLVEGLVPRGAIVLVAGSGGTGKSSIAHHLCVQGSIDWEEDETPMWLGQPVVKDHFKGVCIYFSGEDGPAIINARGEIFDPTGRSKRLMFQRTDFRSKEGDEITFPEFMDRLYQMPDVPLIVVDPARKYLTGDENDAGVVSEFFEAIEEFAIQKNATVMVVHHLSKGAKPQSAREVLDELRGSQVFIDRPRVVIGMYREGPNTVVGLAKCNIPPNLGMVTTERVFARDPKTLELFQLPGEAGVKSEFMNEEELAQLKEAAEMEALAKEAKK